MKSKQRKGKKYSEAIGILSKLSGLEKSECEKRINSILDSCKEIDNKFTVSSKELVTAIKRVGKNKQ